MLIENKIAWVVFCVDEFARRKCLPVKIAFRYLYHLDGIKFLDEHYDAEHLLSFDNAVDDLILVCEAKEGAL